MLGLRSTGIMTTYNKYSKDCASPRSLEKYYSRKKVYIKILIYFFKKRKSQFFVCLQSTCLKKTKLTVALVPLSTSKQTGLL